MWMVNVPGPGDRLSTARPGNDRNTPDLSVHRRQKQRRTILPSGHTSTGGQFAEIEAHHRIQPTWLRPPPSSDDEGRSPPADQQLPRAPTLTTERPYEAHHPPATPPTPTTPDRDHRNRYTTAPPRPASRTTTTGETTPPATPGPHNHDTQPSRRQAAPPTGPRSPQRPPRRNLPTRPRQPCPTKRQPPIPRRHARSAYPDHGSYENVREMVSRPGRGNPVRPGPTSAPARLRQPAEVRSGYAIHRDHLT